jgi:hypothetical protein
MKKFKYYELEEIPEDIINAKLPDDIVNYHCSENCVKGQIFGGFCANWLAQNRVQALQEGLTSIEDIRKLIANFTRPNRAEKIAKEMERRKKGIYG